MKTILNLILLTIFIFLLPSCENEENSEKPSTLTGELSSYSDCKSLKTVQVENDTPDSLSCVEYSFDPNTNLLTIQHINAGFNCCPENLYCDVTLNNDTIIIQEFESDGFCDCNCLYDLDIELNGIDSKKYQVKFIEPYATSNDEINFEIDLSKSTTGSYCLTRKYYPWGME